MNEKFLEFLSVCDIKPVFPESRVYFDGKPRQVATYFNGKKGVYVYAADERGGVLRWSGMYGYHGAGDYRHLIPVIMKAFKEDMVEDVKSDLCRRIEETGKALKADKRSILFLQAIIRRADVEEDLI